MRRVLEDSFKNMLPTDRKRREFFHVLCLFLYKLYLRTQMLLYRLIDKLSDTKQTQP